MVGVSDSVADAVGPAAAAAAALFARHPPLPHLPHHAVAVAPRVAVLEVVRLDAMRGEEEVLQLRAIVRAVRLCDGEARLPRQLEGLELVLQQTRAVSSGALVYRSAASEKRLQAGDRQLLQL